MKQKDRNKTEPISYDSKYTCFKSPLIKAKVFQIGLKQNSAIGCKSGKPNTKKRRGKSWANSYQAQKASKKKAAIGNISEQSSGQKAFYETKKVILY